MSDLISPYGGKLIDLFVSPAQSEELFTRAENLDSIRLTERQIYDLELLASGAFSPLAGFMTRADYQAVLDTLRLADGRVFPIPVTLSTDNTENLEIGQTIVLRDSKNEIVALMEIGEIYEWDRRELARKVFGTLDSRHPLVSESNRWGKYNLAGKLRVLQLPKRFDFQNLRLTPKSVREKLSRMNAKNVVAFQTRNPLHRAHEAMVKRALEQTGGVLLLHPVVGMTKAGDVDYYTRVRTYEAMVEKYLPPDRVLLSLLPLAMRMAGPREAVWHALVRRNYGANHFIVGRDHASPGLDSKGKSFYSPATAAQRLAEEYSAELGVKILKYDEFVYLPDTNEYEELSKIKPERKIFSLSGTEAREEYLKKGKPLPAWFTREEVAKILGESSPFKHLQGVCLWFTGLSGAGKSTTAEILSALILEKGRRVTLLDGDVVRTNLSKGLGFSAEDRDTNIRRIGFVAAEIVKHGGLVICATISPYRATRDDIRNLIGDEQFVEIYVQTPLDICELRDVKGMYAQARKGIIKDFTGINSPYEEPARPEIVLHTVNHTAQENATLILNFLTAKGFIRNAHKDKAFYKDKFIKL
jgi:sulfate adenylyltransferase